MKIMVAVKRVVDYAVKIRVKPDKVTPLSASASSASSPPPLQSTRVANLVNFFADRRGDPEREDVDEPVLRDRARGGPPDQGIRAGLGGRGRQRRARPVRGHAADGARDGGGQRDPRGVQGGGWSEPAVCRQGLEGARGGREARAPHPWQAGFWVYLPCRLLLFV